MQRASRRSAGHLKDALLGEGAELQVDRGGVLAPERQDRFEAHEADDRVHLHVAPHRGGTLAHRHVEHAPGPVHDVLSGEAAFCFAGDPDRLGHRALAARGPSAQQGLVEMNVRIHQARRHRASFTEDLAPGGTPGQRADLDDALAAAGDVGHLPVGQPAVTKQQIEPRVTSAR
jgi:hypothetical protein